MVNIPTNRKMHLVRIFGTNKDGDVIPDIWVDVLRIDEIKIKTQEAQHIKQLVNQFQEVTIRLKWHDKDGVDGIGKPEDETDNSKRRTEIIKVCSPDEEDPDNPSEWVPIRVIKRVNLKNSDVDANRLFWSKISTRNAVRVVEKRRFYHYDTNIDATAAQFAKDNPDKKVFHVDLTQQQTYIKDEETKDKGQYLEHEVITKYRAKASTHEAWSNGTDNDSTFQFKNQYLMDESEVAKLEEVGDKNHTRDYNPPWRLDPFQNIINMQLSGAVKFFDGAS